MGKDYICSHCGKAEVEFIQASFDFTIDHWQCPICDSTYCDFEFKQKPKKETTNANRKSN